MSTPTSYVSQRDQMNARMATEAPSEVLSGFAAAADQLRRPRLRSPRAVSWRPGRGLCASRPAPRGGLPLRAAAWGAGGADLLPRRVVPILQPPAPHLAGPPRSDRRARRSTRGGLATDGRPLAVDGRKERPRIPRALRCGAKVIDRYGLKYDVDAETRAYRGGRKRRRRTQRTPTVGPPRRDDVCHRRRRCRPLRQCRWCWMVRRRRNGGRRMRRRARCGAAVGRVGSG